jgi:chemotaxis protein MotB
MIEEDELQATPIRSATSRHMTKEILASQEPEDEGNWLLSYVDLFTLLVVMFAVMLIFSNPSDTTTLPTAQTSETSVPQTETSLSNRGLPIQLMPPPRPLGIQHDLLTQFQQQLAGLVEQGQIEISATVAGISLQLEEQILFDSGAAELLGQGKTVLDKLAPALKQSGQTIMVEGHTDNRPIATPRFPSNWELSSSRATRVVRYLIEQGIPANRLSATGYADTRPVVDNDTPAGRNRNRRVTILVKPAEGT